MSFIIEVFGKPGRGAEALELFSLSIEAESTITPGILDPHCYIAPNG